MTAASNSWHVALATCQEFAHLEADDRLLLDALGELGIAAAPAVWTDPTIDWATFDAVIVRSTWDYSDRRDDFLAWAGTVAAATTLLNDVPFLAWNTDKVYLRDLAQAGIPIVPTQFLEPGDDVAAWNPSGGDVVVKPAVSCGSRNTMRHAGGDDAAVREHAQRLQREGRVVMVQPYLDAVDEAGETALLFFAGEFSHAIRKGPLLASGLAPERVEGLYLKETIDPRQPTAAQLELAHEVLRAVPDAERLLYARVDLIPDAEGSPVLLELELTEPSLFFGYSEGAAQRLAAAIMRRLTR